MRGLPWKVVPASKTDNTFWEKADDAAVLAKLPVKDLEALFCAKPKDEGKSLRRKKGFEKPKELALINPQRGNNVAIMLSRFKLPYTQLKRAMIVCDDEIFALDKLLIMKPFLPNSEEVQILTAYEGDRGILGKAERFFIEIMNIPFLEERFDALIYKGTFEDKYASINKHVTNLTHAIESVRTSVLFKRILEIILAVGNYLNGGTNRGGAFGFKLSTLPSLLSFRANDGTSLTEYLVRMTRKKFKNVMKWPQEVGIVSEVTDVNMKQLAVEAELLAIGLEKVNSLLAKHSPFSASDGLSSALSPFVRQNEQRVKDLRIQSKEMTEKFSSLCEFFGDDPSTTSEEFFGRIDEFIKAFRGEERKIRIAKEKAKREKRSIFKRGAKPAPPPKTLSSSSIAAASSKAGGPPPPPSKDGRSDFLKNVSPRGERSTPPTTSPRARAPTNPGAAGAPDSVRAALAARRAAEKK